MKKMFAVLSVVVLGVVLVVGACAPKPVPTPSPTRAPAPGVTSQANADQAEWQKVVEAAKKEGQIIGYSGGLLAGDTAIAVTKAFGEKYPGVKLELIAGASANLVARIRAEDAAKKNEADFILTSQNNLLNMKTDGLLQPWGNLPVLADDVWIYFNPKYDPDGYILSFGRYFVVSYVNTGNVKAGKEPTSYFDLLKPEWKGRMVLLHPSIPVMPALYASLKTNNVFDVDDYFTKLGKQDVKMSTAGPEQMTQVAQGEVDLAFASQETFSTPILKKGAPVKPIYFKEGVPVRNLVALGMLAKSPHPNATRLFMNWLFTAEGQRITVEASGGSPNRKDVPDFSPVSKAIASEAKIVFTQNLKLDAEAARVTNEMVLQNLLGLRK